jgi:hypothetical protein
LSRLDHVSRAISSSASSIAMAREGRLKSDVPILRRASSPSKGSRKPRPKTHARAWSKRTADAGARACAAARARRGRACAGAAVGSQRAGCRRQLAPLSRHIQLRGGLPGECTLRSRTKDRKGRDFPR